LQLKSFIDWLKKIFKRQPEKVEPVKPEKVELVKPSLFKEDQSFEIGWKFTPTEYKGKKAWKAEEFTRVLPKRKLTHPNRYRKFFKKRRQPTTARKLWKPQAKIEENEEEVNVA